MSEFMKTVVVVFASLTAFIFLIAGLPILANSGAVDNATATALTTISSDFIKILPYIGVLVAGGLTLMAMQGRRR